MSAVPELMPQHQERWRCIEKFCAAAISAGHSPAMALAHSIAIVELITETKRKEWSNILGILK